MSSCVSHSYGLSSATHSALWFHCVGGSRDRLGSQLSGFGVSAYSRGHVLITIGIVGLHVYIAFRCLFAELVRW